MKKEKSSRVDNYAIAIVGVLLVFAWWFNHDPRREYYDELQRAETRKQVSELRHAEHRRLQENLFASSGLERLNARRALEKFESRFK